MKRFFSVVGFLGILLGATFGVVRWALESVLSAGSEPMVIEVHPGDRFRSVLRRIHEQGGIQPGFKVWILEAWARWRGLSLKQAEYVVPPNTTGAQLLEILSSGRGALYPVTIPEGLNIFELAKLLESQFPGVRMKASEWLDLFRSPVQVERWLPAVPEARSLEGFLFPSTYYVSRKTSGESLIQLMIKTFYWHWAKLQSLECQMPRSLNLLEWVTLASLVEKEARLASERSLIASVYWNRLQKNMLLQADPTVLYAKALVTGHYIRDIRKADLSWDHPYNTYVRMGLPPGPIANPGLESLKAVCLPARTSYLFFVSRNDGSHVFSETYEQHRQYVYEYQIKPFKRSR